MTTEPMAVIVSILSGDEDLQRTCRRLAAEVNHGPMHLARVVATGTQVYPVRLDSLRDTATLLRCEFRMRNTGQPVSIESARDLLDRLNSFEILDSHLVDVTGLSAGPVVDLRVAS